MRMPRVAAHVWSTVESLRTTRKITTGDQLLASLLRCCPTTTWTTLIIVPLGTLRPRKRRLRHAMVLSRLRWGVWNPQNQLPLRAKRTSAGSARRLIASRAKKHPAQGTWMPNRRSMARKTAPITSGTSAARPGNTGLLGAEATHWAEAFWQSERVYCLFGAVGYRRERRQFPRGSSNSCREGA